MDGLIWFEYKNQDDLKVIDIDSSKLEVIKVTDFDTHKTNIELSIQKFNSQIKWDDMWTLQESNERLSRNQILFLLLKDNSPIGHVWYIGEYLYNAFVSQERNTGESQWFIQQTMSDRFKNGYDTITLYTEEWNIRAIKFWEKLGFGIIHKKDLIEHGRERIHQTQGND